MALFLEAAQPFSLCAPPKMAQSARGLNARRARAAPALAASGAHCLLARLASLSKATEVKAAGERCDRVCLHRLLRWQH